MNAIAPISEWRRVFIDTSFIIDLIRNLSVIPVEDPKFIAIQKSQKLLEYFQLVSEQKENQVRWVTSSVVLSELTKFENKDAVDELQGILMSPEVEIINYTRKEASFILNEMGNYIEDKHISQYINDLKKELAKSGVFNPQNYIAKDALIIACAKSKKCDVVLTSDKNSFLPIAKKVGLPILLSENIPLDMHDNVDHLNPIATSY